ncbi:thioredoxin family protein [Qipengyuania vesicularis]|uniref:thioredoxin family protein n=1 Tax=Qipengyuania vesicularis TaxID=2867232 RepID=UPI001C8788D4|nr:thioredoxin family protein [Qipengyuania vesicularis]MBX7528520.1 thioredoxin family protein [Qipengyuania vesicularis]
MKPVLFALAASLALAGCATVSDAPVADHPEARSFDASRDASADVDAALGRAMSSGKHVLLIMGANWCHDSRALAGWLETPRFQQLVEAEYELVFVNVGMPQTGDGHNLDIAQRLGLEELPGTPNLLVLTPFGTLLNADTATSWRNAASRSEDEIYDELVRLAS